MAAAGARGTVPWAERANRFARKPVRNRRRPAVTPAQGPKAPKAPKSDGCFPGRSAGAPGQTGSRFVARTPRAERALEGNWYFVRHYPVEWPVSHSRRVGRPALNSPGPVAGSIAGNSDNSRLAGPYNTPDNIRNFADSRYIADTRKQAIADTRRSAIAGPGPQWTR